ncbi:MAG: 4Fe-4S binding protein [Anaerolineales bacterium]|jgi:ferredoxin
MARPIWFVELIKQAFPGRFTLARATRIEPVGRLIKHLFFEGDELSYLPTNLSIPVGESPSNSGDFVVPEQVIDYFIQKAGFLWVMDECICRSASECKTYPIDLGCLFMGEATLDINPRLGRPVTKDEARTHIERASQEGLVHLIGRNKIDTVWLGVGPGHKLLTVCSCCPCCCLWRMHPHLNPGIQATLHRMPGLWVTVSGACSGCELCLDEVCFVSAIEMDSGRALIGEACLGCGRCVSICPEDAITFQIEDSNFIQSTIDRISPLVDVS